MTIDVVSLRDGGHRPSVGRIFSVLKPTYLFLAIDLTCVVFAVTGALVIRDNLEVSLGRLDEILPFMVFSLSSAAPVFVIAGLNRGVWRYFSLIDVQRIMAAATIAILLAVSAAFAVNRLNGVARSLPVIQWLLLIAAMCACRVAVRWLRARLNAQPVRSAVGQEAAADKQHVLLIGVNHVADLYLRSVAEFAANRIGIVGILANHGELRRRLLQCHEIVGTADELERVLSEVEVHGIQVERIVITEPFDRLTPRAQQALLRVERSTDIELDFFAERLDFFGPRGGRRAFRLNPGRHNGKPEPLAATMSATLREAHPLGRYRMLKRGIDIVGALLLLTAGAPFMMAAVLLVALDVGLPVVFWQLRPGQGGRPFRLYKFRTMAAAHDVDGTRIPDPERSSVIGRLLRRTRFDEMPQLYNVLIGEMSFVGPRPLLPHDQPDGDTTRLLVRPGMTGWAQVNGGRHISVADKSALDVWYLKNASLWLDVKILLQTVVMLIGGERPNIGAIRRACEELGVAGPSQYTDFDHLITDKVTVLPQVAMRKLA
jgi:lipopolysaccharide/colanic/teichoic acid biosynthesis glycosyltransferase